MNIQRDHLRRFFEQIKTLSFWQRIFRWGQIRKLSYEAYDEFQKLMMVLNAAEESRSASAVLNKENEHLSAAKDKLSNELDLLKQKIQQLERENAELSKENIVFKQSEKDRLIQYEKNVENLNSVKRDIQADRQKEMDDRQRQEIARLEAMKETWAQHEETVRNVIKDICERNTIEYVEEVPFKGKPDNTIKICDEFLIFDAKSPSSDDLKNFPLYIKQQTESVKKYVKQEGVHRHIFLVIPSNTVEVIKKFSYNMGDYNVYVVTLDVLEPLMLTLQRIEEYEFVNQLSPEERENICRIIGKFAHMTKRRVQIDHYFAKQFMEIITKCEIDLPQDVLEKVVEFEHSEKLNPPQEKRAKQISSKELEADAEKIQKEMEGKGVVFPTSLQRDMKSLPLYKGEEVESDH